MRFSSHTCSTCINSISVVSCIADACVAAHSVVTSGMFMTIVCVKCTLVDIYSVTKVVFVKFTDDMWKLLPNTDVVYKGWSTSRPNEKSNEAPQDVTKTTYVNQWSVCRARPTVQQPSYVRWAWPVWTKPRKTASQHRESPPCRIRQGIHSTDWPAPGCLPRLTLCHSWPAPPIHANTTGGVLALTDMQTRDVSHLLSLSRFWKTQANQSARPRI